MIKDFPNLQNSYHKGKVYLVGAGPGDVGLLTIRAASVLRIADVIVYDGLINNALLQLFPHPQKIYCGKKRSDHPMRQGEINRLLVDLAQEGKMVVRLKGGDPIVFARGSEEAQYLKESDILFEIIPGVTSGHAVPAYAGIPVTDRDVSSVVIFVTGQEREDKNGSFIDWKTLAPIEGSLVIYMGVKSLPFIVKNLMEAGKPSDTLVSVIEAGTLPRQKVIEGTLASIVDKINDQNVESPAIIVIGEVNKLRKKLNWFNSDSIEEREKLQLSLEIEFARTLTEEYEHQINQSKQIANVKNLKHGGEIDGFAREIGKDRKSIFDFSSNINPLGISPKVKKVYEESFSCISEYPDSYAQEFCQEVAQRLSVSADNVIAGNGAISLIDLTIRSVRPRKALVIEPCFNEYRRLLELYGAQVQPVFLKEERGFNFPYEDIIKRLEGIDMVILGHPNNPTGTALKRQEMISLIQETKRRGIFLLVDEAFVDWNPELSIYQEIKRSSSLAVIRSLTKFFGLAGIRSGFALAAPEVIAKMRSIQEPWSCNALAQRLSIAALQDLEFQQRSLGWFKEESNEFYRRLSQFSEIKVFPSSANFFLVKLNDMENRERFWNFIKSQGIYMREMNDIEGLNNCYFRIALKDQRQNVFLIKKFKEALVKDKCLLS